jgi:hypothetical protein
MSDLATEYKALTDRRAAYERRRAAALRTPGTNQAAIFRALQAERDAYETAVRDYNSRARHAATVQKSFDEAEQRRRKAIEAEHAARREREREADAAFARATRIQRAVKNRERLCHLADDFTALCREAALATTADRLQRLKARRSWHELHREVFRVAAQLKALPEHDLARRMIGVCHEKGYPHHAWRIAERLRERDDHALMSTLEFVADEILR